MASKIFQIGARSHSFKGFLLKDICKVGKSLPFSVARGPSTEVTNLSVEFYPGMTRDKFLVSNSFVRTTIPLHIDPPKAIISDLPIVPIKKEIIYRPFNNINLHYEDVPTTKVIEDPTPSPLEEKKAARLIVIRRRKMKRHQLKKLRIRMKFEWAKLRQKRELKKEKEFQAELLGQIKEAEKFDAKAYCAEKIQKANAVIITKRWKGKRLPEFIIKDLIKKRDKKIAELKEMQLKRKSMSMKVSDYPS